MDALVGVVVGALLTGAFTWWADQRRWARDDDIRSRDHAREDRVRWIADRRKLYVDYLAAAHRAEQLGKEAQHGFVYARQFNDTGDTREAANEHDRASGAWNAYVEATEDMRRALAELELVAPSNVAAIADELNVAVIGLVDALTRQTRGAPSPAGAVERDEQVVKIEERHRTLLDELKRAVRCDLGVDVEAVPRGRG